MQIKLVIWDLDDTLWAGTLADGEVVRLNDERAAVIRTHNERGIVSSICSKNARVEAQRQLARSALASSEISSRKAVACCSSSSPRRTCQMKN